MLRTEVIGKTTLTVEITGLTESDQKRALKILFDTARQEVAAKKKSFRKRTTETKRLSFPEMGAVMKAEGPFATPLITRLATTLHVLRANFVLEAALAALGDENTQPNPNETLESMARAVQARALKMIAS